VEENNKCGKGSWVSEDFEEVDVSTIKDQVQCDAAANLAV
jgi:hypothetical protein